MVRVNTITRVDNAQLMRASKEAKRFEEQSRGHFAEQMLRGLQLSGFFLRPSEARGEAVGIIVPGQDSNTHTATLLSGEVAPEINRLAQTFPTTYVTHFNTIKGSERQTESVFYRSAQEALIESVMQVLPSGLKERQTTGLGFAHIAPSTHHEVYGVIGLSPNMVGIITQQDDVPKIVQPSVLPRATESGIRVGIFKFYRGETFVLATNPPGYKDSHALEGVGIMYQHAKNILSAARKDTVEAYKATGLSSYDLEAVATAVDSLSYTSDDFKRAVKNGDFMQLAAMLARVDVSRSTKDARGNFILPDRFSAIATSVPPISLRRNRTI